MKRTGRAYLQLVLVFLTGGAAIGIPVGAGVAGGNIVLGALIAVVLGVPILALGLAGVLTVVAAGARNEPIPAFFSAVRKGWRMALGFLGLSLLWMIGAVVFYFVLMVIIGIVVGIVAAAHHLPVSTIMQSHGTHVLAEVLLLLVIAAASPLSYALEGRVFVLGEGAGAAFGPALRDGYSRKWLPLWVTLGTLVALLAIGLRALVSPGVGQAVVNLLVEPALIWAILSFVFSAVAVRMPPATPPAFVEPIRITESESPRPA